MLKSFLHYQIIEKLGEGGMGIVYHARDTKLKRSVALKFLPSHIADNSLERKRFQNEAQSAAALNHPNIAQVYAIEEMNNELFIVMEYVEGQELKEAIEEQGLTLEAKCTIASQIAEGMKAAHDKGVIHRDIKTRNIMLDRNGKIKIMDFGLARIQDEAHITKAGTTLGTTAYMSPEQLAGEEAGIQSDIWSFGVVLYELFTGELPFQGVYEPAVMYAITEEEPRPASSVNPGIPENIERVIQNCLAKQKESRYQKVDEIMADLAGDGTVDRRKSIPLKTASGNKASYFLVRGVPAVILLIIILFFFQYNFHWLGRSNPPKRYLAVLPIENIGNNPSMQAICEGLAETFSFKLSELENYEDSYWVAPASEMREEKVRSATQANKLFGVNLAIVSSIQTFEDSTRLILNLVDADKVRQLETRQVVVPSQNVALLEENGVRAMMQMLEIENNSTIDKALRKGGPSNPRAYEFYLKGRATLQDYATLDSLENAITFFGKAIEVDPEFALAYAGLGESLWRKYEAKGDTAFARNAESVLKKAEKLNNRLAPVQTLLGVVGSGTGDYKLAVNHFNRALEIDPNYTPAYRGLANVYEKQGKMEKAVATYQYAIALKPEISVGYNDLGAFYLRKGDFKAAIEQFKKEIALTPKNAGAYSNLGSSYYYQGKLEQASEAYQMSLALENDPDVASNLAGVYYLKGSYEQAAKMYEISLQALPDRYDLWANLAAVYDQNGEEDKARKSYLTAIEKGRDMLEVNPNDAEVMADVGAYYSDVGDSSNAIKYITNALSFNEDNIMVRQRAISIYEKLGMREEAIHWVNAALVSYVEAQPELKNLAEDPRYLEIKEKFTPNRQL
ncbi:MAG: protein kinase [Balneolaceae bacterium]|jgi:serine/threonine protein kinase/tetratricopeptide (TPR) repeat protein